MRPQRRVQNTLDSLLKPNGILRGALGTLGLPLPSPLYRGFDGQALGRSFLEQSMGQNRILARKHTGLFQHLFESSVRVGRGKLPSVIVDLRGLEERTEGFAGIVAATKAGLKHVQKAGRLVVVSSGTGSPRDVWSSAVHGTVLSLHQEVGKHGIGVNHVVDRTYVKGNGSQYSQGDSSDPLLEEMPKDDPAWFASAYLCSPPSAFVTGQQVVVEDTSASANDAPLRRLLGDAVRRAEAKLAGSGQGGASSTELDLVGGADVSPAQATPRPASISIEAVRRLGALQPSDAVAHGLLPLEGSVALVTGAARGIGAAVARRLSDEGAAVLCVDVPGNQEALDGTARAVGGIGLALDVTSEDAPLVLRRALRETAPVLRGAMVGGLHDALLRRLEGGRDTDSESNGGLGGIAGRGLFAHEALQLGASAVLDASDFSPSAGQQDAGDGEAGCLDLLIHNAGVTRDRSLGRMSEAEAKAVFGVNLESILRMEEAIGARQRIRCEESGGEVPVLADGGRVVLLSSIVGRAGAVGQCAYAATKNAVAAYAEEAGQHEGLRAAGVTVNAIAPGFIETEMTQKIPVFGREVARRMSSFMQGGLPWDVAASIGFLCAPGAGGVSGQTIRVCGGHIIGR